VFGGARQHSVWLFTINTGACNACDQEIAALHAARYSLARRGIAFASSPRHADILLVTGVLTPRCRKAARAVWEQLAEPRAIVAIGDCPINGSVFRVEGQALGIGEALPVDVEVPGCPPTPALILQGIEEAIKLLDGEAPEEEEAEPAPEGEEQASKEGSGDVYNQEHTQEERQQ
jgi:membrane-bound hydrogenase subunit mbhJ